MKHPTTINFAVCIACSLYAPTAISENHARGTPTALGAIFNDDHIAESALQVHLRAASMPANERFDFLIRWVLPSEHHATFRLQVAFTPTHALGHAAIGGQLVSPALDLVNVAAELNMLDALWNRIEAASPHNSLMAKNQAALSAMVLLKQTRVEDALVYLDRVRSLSTEEQPDDQVHRSAEAVLFSTGSRHPQVQEILRDAMDRIVQRQRKNNVWTIWSRQFRTLLAPVSDADTGQVQTGLQGGPEAVSGRTAAVVQNSTSSEQWMPVSFVTAESRGCGMPPAKWRIARGQADHQISHGDDFLYFNSPLRGTFQIECDCTAFNWDGSEVQIGGTWVRPIYTHAAYDVGNMRSVFTRQVLAPPLTKIRGKLHYRTVVEQNTATTYVNGRKLHVQPMSDVQDPWVSVRNDYRNAGRISNMRVTGVPDIPEVLDISAPENLEGWLPYFGGSVGSANSHWQGLNRVPRFVPPPDPDQHRGGGIFAARRDDVPSGSHHEEALFYHRPMLEDGSIEYEFFYREGEISAHPAMDRLCFLMHPTGVRIHWLTDGVFERTALSPDNESLETEILRGPDQIPLLADAWNRVRVALSGNVVQLKLNGYTVCERELEPNNQRRFGFFHFADRTDLQVRNVMWKGNWPRRLPPVSAQHLAADEGDFLDRDVDHLSAVFTHDFVKDGLPGERFAIVEGQPGVDVVATPEGVKAMRSGPGGYRNAKIAPRLEVHGDFDIVVTYDQFESAPPKAGSSTIFLIARLENQAQDHFFVTRRHIHDANGKQDHIMQCAIVRQRPEGEQREHFLSAPMEERSGRLRLARRGNLACYLSAEHDSPNFRLWATREFNTDPIAADGVVLLSQIHQLGFTSVIWKRITVKAEKLSGAAMSVPDTER